jgi:hypothetical protein
VVDILDVRIDVDDDVPVQDVQGLPEVLTLALETLHFRQDLVGQVHVHPVAGGDLPGLVGASRIDDGDLVQQGVAEHQLALHYYNLFGDGLLFVQGGKA